MMIKYLSIISLIFLTFSCVSSLPPIESDSWNEAKNWPAKIQDDKKCYNVEFTYSGPEGINVCVDDVKQLKSGVRFSAHYCLNPEDKDYYKVRDYYLGPFFAWRSDGSIYLKVFYYENGNVESYYIFPNGQKTFHQKFDKETKLFTEYVYNMNRKLLGFSKEFDGCPPYTVPADSDYCKKSDTENDIYVWNGKQISKEEYRNKISEFRSSFKEKLKIN